MKLFFCEGSFSPASDKLFRHRVYDQIRNTPAGTKTTPVGTDALYIKTNQYMLICLLHKHNLVSVRHKSTLEHSDLVCTFNLFFLL